MEQESSRKLRGIAEEIGVSILSAILALLVGAVIVAFLGVSPLRAYLALINGAFGSVNALAGTVTKTVPLIFTGLAVALAFRCGLFNIGGEGQLYLGALAAVLIAIALPGLPRFILLPLAVLGGMAVGFVWGGIPGLLKARFQTHEVIVSVMLNYVAIFLVSYLVNYQFKAKGPVAQTDTIPQAASLRDLIPRSQLTTAVFIAIVAVFIVYWLLWKTSLGFEIRATGENAFAAEAAGISRFRSIVISMGLSGALASLAGITQVLGIYGRFIVDFSPGYGFTGIAVAVLGRNHPFGVLLSALLFGVLESGALRMNITTRISADLVVFIQGLVILFVAAPGIIRGLRIHIRNGRA